MSNTPSEAEPAAVSLTDITALFSAEMEARRVSWEFVSEKTGVPVDTLRFQLLTSPIHLTLTNTLRVADALDIPIVALAGKT